MLVGMLTSTNFLYVSSRAGKGVKVVGMLISTNFLNGRGEMSASAKLEV